MHRFNSVRLHHVPMLLLAVSRLGAATSGAIDTENLRVVFADQIARGNAAVSTWRGPDICQSVTRWDGVTCTTEPEDPDAQLDWVPRLKDITIASSGLIGTLNLTPLKTMDALGVIVIGVNPKLTGPVDLTNLPPALVTLSIWFNKLSGTLDLTKLPPTLETIALDNNEFTGSVNLVNLPVGLKNLLLTENELSGPLDLEHLPESLSELALQGNKFTGPVNLLALPPSLTHLELHDNQLSGPLDLSKLPVGLGDLRLNNNKFNGTIALNHLPNAIRFLQAEENDFTRVHFPLKVPNSIIMMLLMPNGGWESVCFIGTLDMSGHDVANVDIPPVGEQVLCTAAPTPVPTTAEPTPEPTATVPIGSDSTGNVSGSKSTDASSMDAKCHDLFGFSCLRLGLMAGIPLLVVCVLIACCVSCCRRRARAKNAVTPVKSEMTAGPMEDESPTNPPCTGMGGDGDDDYSDQECDKKKGSGTVAVPIPPSMAEQNDALKQKIARQWEARQAQSAARALAHGVQFEGAERILDKAAARAKAGTAGVVQEVRKADERIEPAAPAAPAAPASPTSLIGRSDDWLSASRVAPQERMTFSSSLTLPPLTGGTLPPLTGGTLPPIQRASLPPLKGPL